MAEFKDMLKYFRSLKGLSQSELAKELGVSTSAISMYEVGKREPDFETEEKFADFIGISRSNCNKMKKAVEFRDSNETFNDWTLNKIYEIMCLPKDEAPQLLVDYMIDKDDTVKEIREAVKAYKEDTTESKVVADVEPEEAEPKTEETEPKTEEDIPMKDNGTKESLLHSFIDTLTTEETVKVLSYIKKQHIGATDAVEEVLKLWK